MSKPGNKAGAIQAALRLIKAHGYSIVSADSMLEREKWIESNSVEVVGGINKVRIKPVKYPPVIGGCSYVEWVHLPQPYFWQPPENSEQESESVKCFIQGMSHNLWL
jgi:hypothetical protein